MGNPVRSLSAIVVVAGMLALWGCASSKPAGESSLTRAQAGASMPLQAKGATTANYISEEGARLSAYFDNAAGTVQVTLPSGRTVTLPRALSGSGVRYSNGPETFWEHHGEATYWIGEKQVFRGQVEE